MRLNTGSADESSHSAGESSAVRPSWPLSPTEGGLAAWQTGEEPTELPASFIHQLPMREPFWPAPSVI